jgi:hypothetical protein
MSIQELAKMLSSALVTGKRNDGKDFVHLKDKSPQWMTYIIQAVHGDKLPDDTTYALIGKCADVIAEAESPADAIYEIEPDVYTSDLTGWLHARVDQTDYVNEAIEEGFDKDVHTITDLLMMAQARQIQEVGNALISALESVEDETAQRA